jgi:hypothetical protein
MSTAFDVAIIDGGPAGSAAGTLLARAGRRVVIFEKEKFPRFSVGESTLPAILNTLERMGVREKIDQGGFLIKHGGEIVSACGQRVRFYFRNERRVGRVLDIYLRWASAWYTQEFVEVFLFPKEIFEIVPTVSAVLSGNEIRDFRMRWRLCIFHMLVALQKRTSKIAPKLTLTPRTT